MRLLYVTPERVAQSKQFQQLLHILNQNNRLARFVIDECHCCSEYGHEFRPDYRKLAVLK